MSLTQRHFDMIADISRMASATIAKKLADKKLTEESVKNICRSILVSEFSEQLQYHSDNFDTIKFRNKVYGQA